MVVETYFAIKTYVFYAMLIVLGIFVIYWIAILIKELLKRR